MLVYHNLFRFFTWTLTIRPGRWYPNGWSLCCRCCWLLLQGGIKSGNEIGIELEWVFPLVRIAAVIVFLSSGLCSVVVARHVEMHGRGGEMLAVLPMVALWRSPGLVVEGNRPGTLSKHAGRQGRNLMRSKASGRLV